MSPIVLIRAVTAPHNFRLVASEPLQRQDADRSHIIATGYKISGSLGTGWSIQIMTGRKANIPHGAVVSPSGGSKLNNREFFDFLCSRREEPLRAKGFGTTAFGLVVAELKSRYATPMA